MNNIKEHFWKYAGFGNSAVLSVMAIYCFLISEVGMFFVSASGALAWGIITYYSEAIKKQEIIDKSTEY